MNQIALATIGAFVARYERVGFSTFIYLCLLEDEFVSAPIIEPNQEGEYEFDFNWVH
ncbi:hypothetical protein RJD24_08910 [Bacillaceae bacterium IKA-2]|nr:hypothetical protein RJD24_08910 [Bacillaceae bacterium IKA-2]